MNGRISKLVRLTALSNTVGETETVTRKEIKKLKRELKASRHPQQGTPKRKGYFRARKYRAA